MELLIVGLQIILVIEVGFLIWTNKHPANVEVIVSKQPSKKSVVYMDGKHENVIKNNIEYDD